MGKHTKPKKQKEEMKKQYVGFLYCADENPKILLSAFKYFLSKSLDSSYTMAICGNENDCTIGECKGETNQNVLAQRPLNEAHYRIQLKEGHETTKIIILLLQETPDQFYTKINRNMEGLLNHQSVPQETLFFRWKILNSLSFFELQIENEKIVKNELKTLQEKEEGIIESGELTETKNKQKITAPLLNIFPNKKGLFIGNFHYDLASVKTITKKLKFFAENGVKYFFMESPKYLSRSFELFNKTRDIHYIEIFCEYINYQVSVEGVKQTFIAIAQAIKESNAKISLIPVDGALGSPEVVSSRLQEDPEGLIRDRDIIITHNIKEFMKNCGDDEKVVGLFGLSHIQVARELDFAALGFCPEKEKTAYYQEVLNQYDEYHITPSPANSSTNWKNYACFFGVAAIGAVAVASQLLVAKTSDTSTFDPSMSS